MPPRLPLPPLPPIRTWKQHFPRGLLAITPDPAVQRETTGRIFLTNRSLVDQFVRSLHLRDDEVVLEGFSGPGVVTRSLLNGGWPEDETVKAEEWIRAGPEGVGTGAEGMRKVKAKDGDYRFPTWLEDLRKELEKGGESLRGEVTDPTTIGAKEKPKVVIAIESSPEILVRGLGLEPCNIPKPTSNIDPTKPSDDPQIDESGADISFRRPKVIDLRKPSDQPVTVFKSHHDDRLLLSPMVPYYQPVLPGLLEHELIKPYLEVYDVSQPNPTKRPWSAPPPPITYVAQIPDSERGETMAVAYILQSIGAAHGRQSWIYEYGRVRLALLVGRPLYDRIMAKPTETIYCKLSVFVNALFHIRPLPPYHHVPNVDKASRAISARPMLGPHVMMSKLNKAERAIADMVAGAEEEQHVRTLTHPDDFYPRPGRMENNDPLGRTLILGLELIPRENSVITPEQKDAWDYVLRRCFVKQSTPLRETLPALGFGGEMLGARVEGKEEVGTFKGVDVDLNKVVKDLDVEEWARVVDVFHYWPFRPSNLLLEELTIDDMVARPVKRE